MMGDKSEEFIAVHSKEYSYGIVPAHIKRVYYDDQERRCTQFIITCQSVNYDNDYLVDRIAKFLNDNREETK